MTVGIISGVFTKGMAFMLTLISVPMTLHYLGAERYGIWVTMISMLAWISMADLGVANGLTPLLSAAFGKDRPDLARGYISTAFWGLVGISTLAISVIAVCWQWFDWAKAFNIVDPSRVRETSTAMALAIGLFFLALPFTITQRIYLSYQQGGIANIWQLASSFSGLVGIYVVTQMQGDLVYLVIGYSGAQLVVLLVNSIWLFGWSRPELRPLVVPNLLEFKQVMTMSGWFFINQIATLLVFQKDTILITHFLGSTQAANYSVAWQMFLYLNAINIIVAPYLGPAFGEAHARGDLHWMRIVVRRYLTITMSFALPAIIVLTLFYKTILTAWVGPDVIPEMSTILWLGLWTLIMSIQWPIITLLNSTGRLRVFTLFHGLAAVLNLVLSIFFIQMYGVLGGIMSSAITMLVLVLTPSIREILLVLKVVEKT